ncbi:endonuclease YncB(thermonuclease family) [Paenibacillus sp. PastF-3]|uniref:ABC transporter ATP-binding protein n=1 Tax=Paenibacillus sp. PastF-3 TaxID=2940626 RepID=UPI002475D78A|nr:ABC transporter ATP-binding protein [Paenibacillus sp. PastF-3]MDH6371764.1 endonuclease YncB(thermonuclease family) [Paenibacillus sp. PastF-3]
MPFGNVIDERLAIESTYEGLATVFEIQDVKDPVTRKTRQQPVMVLAAEPCALSQTSLPASTQTVTADQVNYDAKLFISPDVVIKPGSRITIVQDGMTFEGEQAGKPFRYPTHQEIKLKEVLNA